VASGWRRAVTVAEVLGASAISEDEMRFAIGRELHGAFGGAFGGAVAACTVATARRAAPGRVPTAIDVRFLRGLPAGTTTARSRVLQAGRSVSVIDVDVTGPDDRPAARATVSLVDRSTLHPLDEPQPAPAIGRYDDAKPWVEMPGVEIPILTTLAPRILGRSVDGIATALRVPWDPHEDSAAEACCFAADLCVGPPVAAACVDGWIPHPNPDLSLRFAVAPVFDREVAGLGTVTGIAGGVAAVSITVCTAGTIAATGVSTSLLLATKAPK